MDKIDWLKDAFLQNWATTAITAILAVCFAVPARWLLHAFGKEDGIKPERRKYFYGAVSVLAFVSLLMLQHFNKLLEDIRHGTTQMQKGGLQASVIWASVASNKLQPATNLLQVGTISSVGSGHIANGLDMLFIVRVANSGQQSTAWGWKAYGILPGGKRIEGSIPSIAAIFDTSDPKTNQTSVVPTVIGPYSFTMDKNLPQSLSASPLTTGSGTIGWLIMHLNGLNTPETGMHFVITFDDVYGHQTKIEHVWEPPFN